MGLVIEMQFPALREFGTSGKPICGTCAGLIFLADKAVGQKAGGQDLLGGLDCTVHRNFFGCQVVFSPSANHRIRSIHCIQNFQCQ
jgi:glutamine amidotransferase PdxT